MCFYKRSLKHLRVDRVQADSGSWEPIRRAAACWLNYKLLCRFGWHHTNCRFLRGASQRQTAECYREAQHLDSGEMTLPATRYNIWTLYTLYLIWESLLRSGTSRAGMIKRAKMCGKIVFKLQMSYSYYNSEIEQDEIKLNKLYIKLFFFNILVSGSNFRTLS